MWALLLLLIPLLIVLGLMHVLIALVGGFFELLGPAWPVVLIAAGAWMFWRDGRPRRQYGYRRASWHGPRPISATVAQKPSPARGTATPPKTDRAPQPELPIDVQVKVEQIRRKIEVLLSYADRFPPFSRDLYLVRQTASEYLPHTIDAFLKLPKGAVDKPITTDGKTPLQELKTQLDLLDAKLDEIAQALQRQDLDRLLANRQFLEERFGRATA